MSELREKLERANEKIKNAQVEGKMTPKHSELFLKCWEHNLEWGKTLLNEYFLTKDGGKGYGLKLVFSYAIKQGKKLIRKCQNNYDYDLPAMIKAAREGKINVAPLPIRFLYKLLQPKAYQESESFGAGGK